MAFQRNPVAAAAIAALSLSVVPAALHAQTAAPPAAAASAAADAAAEARRNTAAPETVIVTGSRRAQAASKAAYNVTAIGEEALRESNITDAKKLISQSVGISAPGNSARFADSVTVRGLNVSEVNANNLESFVRSTLSYYLDDTPLPNLNYRIKDVARVETLLGPQGTLYGAGSLGGTVRYITNRPKLGATEGRVSTSFYQTVNGGLSNDTDGVFNLPIGSNFALRGAVSRLDEKGYTDRLSNPPWRTGADAWVTKPDPSINLYKRDDWQKVEGGRFSGLWKVTPGFEVVLAHTTQDQKAHGTSGASILPLGVANATTPAAVNAAWRNPGVDCPVAPCRYDDNFLTPIAVNDHTILARYPEFAYRTLRLNSIDIDIDLGFAALHSSTSQYKDRRDGQGDYASQGWSFYYDLGDLGGAIDSGRSALLRFDNRYEGVTHETRLTSKGDGPLSWIAGIFHTRQKQSLAFSEVLPGMDAFLGAGKAATSPVPDVGYDELISTKYRETALFGEVGYRITAPWTVTVGARVFNYRDNVRTKIVDYAGGFVDNDVTAEGGENGKSYYKVNSAYQFTDNLLGYATVSQGFRRGGTNGFRNVGTRVLSDEAKAYKPDSTTNYELGLKGYLLDRALYLEAGVYRIDWKDTQTYRSQLISGFPVNGTVNGPDAQTQGLEFSARYRFSPQWQTTLSGSTTKGKWADTATNCLYTNGTSCRTWLDGGTLGGAPKFKGAAGVRFNTELGGDWLLWASATARHVGKVQTDRSDDPNDNGTARTYAAYTTADASIGVSSGPWDLQLWAENLADKRAVTSNQAGGLMGRRLIYIKPRTVGLNASYSF